MTARCGTCARPPLPGVAAPGRGAAAILLTAFGVGPCTAALACHSRLGNTAPHPRLRQPWIPCHQPRHGSRSGVRGPSSL
eukprot:3749384-Lingulodinium_polyedra.AAC.1